MPEDIAIDLSCNSSIPTSSGEEYIIALFASNVNMTGAFCQSVN
jgi:hypothetical protein